MKYDDIYDMKDLPDGFLEDNPGIEDEARQLVRVANDGLVGFGLGSLRHLMFLCYQTGLMDGYFEGMKETNDSIKNGTHEI